MMECESCHTNLGFDEWKRMFIEQIRSHSNRFIVKHKDFVNHFVCLYAKIIMGEAFIWLPPTFIFLLTNSQLFMSPTKVFIYGLPTDKASPVIWFFPVHKYRSAFLLF